VKERTTPRGVPGSLSGFVVAIAQGGGLDVVVEATARALRLRGADVVLIREPDEGPIARDANASVARCLVVARLEPGASSATGLYFASERSESPSGRHLAELLAEGSGRALGVDEAVRGMTLTVLRESRMPAAVLEIGPLDRVVERTAQLAAGVAAAVETWATPSS
jgi:N-acetylmuramoyl-L-alanine amidase